MREIVFDTETTGRSPDAGDRLVELGCIELMDLSPTGRTFHRYCNPERDVPEEVVRIHGLTTSFLADKPLFSNPNVVDEFIEFVGDAQLIAHNAEFDRRFLNAELGRCGRQALPQDRFIDTLVLARKKFPGQSNSLDALCKRFNVSLSTRNLHGALIDSALLAEVYLELKGGRARRLEFTEPALEIAEAVTQMHKRAPARQRAAPLRPAIDPLEEAAHAEYLRQFSTPPLWFRIGVRPDQI